MNLRRRRKDGFLADYTLDSAYLQKPDTSQARPGLFAGYATDGSPVLVKEWARNSGAHDEDLEPIWRHEMRQLHRLAGYPGAAESIAPLHDAGYDNKGFYLVLAPGQRQPLQTFLSSPRSDHWLKFPRVSSNRARVWANLRRLAFGLEALHAQGLLHRNLDAWAVLTAGGADPDFQLTGFEWSMRITDRARRGAIRSGAMGSGDSFVRDWTLFGLLAGDLLGAKRERLVDASIPPSDIAEHLNVEEARLLRSLLQMMPPALLNGEKVAASIDSVLRGLAADAASRQAKYHLAVRLGVGTQLAEKIREASDQSIETDNIDEQLKFIVSDLSEAPLVIAHRPKDAPNYRLLLRGRSLYYRLVEFRPARSTTPTWDFAYSEAVDSAPAPAGVLGNLSLTPESLVVVPLRDAFDKYPRLRGKLSSWMDVRRQFEHEAAAPSQEETVYLALELLHLLEAIYAAADVYAVEIQSVPRNLPSAPEEGGQWLCVSLRKDPEREALSTALGLNPPAVRFAKTIDSENVGSETWLLAEARHVGERDATTSEWQFQRVLKSKERQEQYLFAGLDGAAYPREPVMFVESVGQDVQLKRRSKALTALKEHQELLRMIIDPRERIVDSHEKVTEDEAFRRLDAPKQEALRQLTSTIPLFLVQGPPGVGKTRLVRDLVQRRFADEPDSRLLLTAQSNAAIDHLMDELEDSLGARATEMPLVVRSSKKDPKEPPSKFDIQVQTRDLVRRLANSSLANDLPPRLRESLVTLAAAPDVDSLASGPAMVGSRGPEQALRIFEGVVARAANIVFATTNSGELERLIEERGQFDWAIVEEAAKATGSELISPLLLSHRRLMIGDHQQLPAFASDQMKALLSDPQRVSEAKKLGKEFIARALRDSTTDDLLDDEDEDNRLPALCAEALRLLTYFGSTIETEFERQKRRNSGRPIAKRLTSQHRMHPVIAQMVSRCFYGDLDTDHECALRFQRTTRPFDSIDANRLPVAPIVVVDMPYVQSNIGQAFGDCAPVWHNPHEVEAAVEVLTTLRAHDIAKPPSLSVLSPYAQQRRRLDNALHEHAGGKLAHLTRFRSPSHSGERCFTVDSFQGSEADVVVVSLVRNNAHSSAQQALGFLCDKRRMNVLLSRAKWQLILITSLEFLREVVAAAKGGADEAKVSFLGVMLDYLKAGEIDGTVARVSADQLMRRQA